MTDRAEREAELRAVRDRLTVPAESGADVALTSYLRFRDALTAAGLARSLDADTAEVRELLADAGAAALEVLNAPAGELGDLDTGGRPDTSTANPLTLLYGLYAALAAGDATTASDLAVLPPGRYHTPQAQASELLDATALALQAAARGDRDQTARLAGEALSRSARDRGSYPSQLAALVSWATGKPANLDAVAAAGRAAAAERDTEGDPVVQLELPVLGLGALE